MLFSKQNFFVFLIIASFLALASKTSPWPFDPLSKVNLTNIEASADKNKTIEEKPKICPPPISCPVCPIVEEWPIDFDGDDLAERVQRRSCGTQNLLENSINEEIFVVIDSNGEPIIYKSNISVCEPHKQILFSHLERVDFNKDNLDELLVVEHNIEKNSDEVKILGFNHNQNVVVELPVINPETDLTDVLTPGESVSGTKPRFTKKNASYGFIVDFETELGRILRVYYFQDSADRAFYPLRIITTKSKTLALKKASASQKQVSPASSIEFIE